MVRWRQATDAAVTHSEILATSAQVNALSDRLDLFIAGETDDAETRALLGASTGAAAALSLVRRDSFGLARFNQPFADVYRTSAQSIANTSYIAISWSGASAQRGPMWASGNPTRLTNPFPFPARFFITVNLAFDNNASGVRYLMITKNGGNSVARINRPGAVFAEMSLTSFVTLGPVEFCEVVVYQDSGTTINVVQVADWTPVASIEMSLAQPTTARVHALGDSITYGSGAIPATIINGGYRSRLYDTALADGKVIDFVGTQTGNSAGMAYPKHDGWSGYAIDSILSLVTGGYLDGVTADVILLNVGANDIKTEVVLSEFPMRYDRLVTAILSKWPYARLVCATVGPYITPWGGDGSGYDMMLYQPTANVYIRSLPSSHPMGHRILVADLAATLTTGNLPDGLHPNATGYQQMADAWWDVLTTII